MTQVVGWRWRERAALSLGRNFSENGGNRIVHFARSDIPKVRRMAWEGKSADQIISELGLTMSKVTFYRRCKELQINLSKGRPRA